MKKRDIAAQVITEFSPETPSRTIGRVLHTRFPTAFPTLDNARDAVRYVRGSQGAKLRRKIGNNSLFSPAALEKLLAEMPKSDSDAKPALDISDSGRSLVFSDVHLRYHDEAAIKTMIRSARDEGIQSIIMLGDIVDFYKLSRFSQDPTKADVVAERDAYFRFVDVLRSVWKDARIIYKLGNHEDRLEQYLRRAAPALYGVEEFRLEALFAHADVEFVDSPRMMNYCGLTLLHGHEVGRHFTSPVNPARGLFLRLHSTALCGHLHRPSEHPEMLFGGNIVTCWSLGCMCDLSPEYLPVNKWIHGFALLSPKNDSFDLRLVKIIDGVAR